MNTIHPQFRASAPLDEMRGLAQFGLLINLAGTWMGKGFNLVSLPLPPSIRNGDPNKKFIPKIGTTREVLAVAPLGAPIPNRGFVQEDIFLFGMTYLQVVTDAVSSEARHFETGLWLNVPDTPAPTIVRQAVIPHGDALLARGTITQAIAPPDPQGQARPNIPVSSSTPIDVSSGDPITTGPYLDPFTALVLPPQTIKETITIDVNTGPIRAGVLNIPFVKDNAEAISMNATFWIETVLRDDKETHFVQLQYSQTVMLRFNNVDWPHISVATLIRQ